MDKNIDKDLIYKCCDLVQKICGYYDAGYLTYFDMLSHVHDKCVNLYKVRRMTDDKIMQRTIDVTIAAYKKSYDNQRIGCYM